MLGCYEREYYGVHPKYGELVNKYIYLSIDKSKRELPLYEAQLELIVNSDFDLIDNETSEERKERFAKVADFIIDDLTEIIVFPFVSDEIDTLIEKEFFDL